MPTLTEFLLARITEEEALARRALPYVAAPGARIEIRLSRTESLPDGTRRGTSETMSPYDPARVLRECEAKRQIVGHAAYAEEEGGGYADCTYGLLLPALAEVYADHPDYDETWRP